MAVHNTEIADLFQRYATLLEMDGANPFRVRAYRNAAQSIRDLPNGVDAMLAAGEDLSELPGIGRDLGDKIAGIVGTGRFGDLEKLKRRLPGSLADLAVLPGIGPKRVKILYDTLGIETLSQLRRAAEQGRIREIPGFGEKTEARILKEIGRKQQAEPRVSLLDAERTAEPLLRHLQQVPGVKDAVVAGSYRRRKETVGDLDLLVTCRQGCPVMERFTGHEDVAEVLSKGPTRSTVRLRGGLQVDLRVVPQASYGAALYYFTGSKAHNVAVRTIAVRKGLKVNEYGVFRGSTRVAGRTEQEVFKTVGLPYIEPELREDRGEIEAAKARKLPHLVTLDDVRGDLHVHTKASDGKHTIDEMAEAARARGYEYLAINDHSRRVTVARGLDPRRLAAQIKEIDRINARLRGLRILRSSEVDILEDGSLDLPDGILRDLDLTVCSVHYKFNLSRDEQTERIIRAMDNPYFTILGHPTGRLIGSREAYAIDIERVMDAALERGCFLELNAQPDRLDLSDAHCKMAKDKGIKIALSTDAHTTGTLDYMRFGIDQARRGWLEPGDVLNTRSWAALKKLLARV